MNLTDLGSGLSQLAELARPDAQTAWNWLTDGSKALGVLGLSVVGLFSAAKWTYVRARRGTNGLVDRRRLGDSYAAWHRLAGQVPNASTGTRSLVRTVASTKKELASIMVRSLRKDIESRLASSASGTIDLTYADICATPGLVLPERFVSPDGTAVIAIEKAGTSVPMRTRAKSGEMVSPGLLMVAPAGMGKSTFCRLAEYSWLQTGDEQRWIMTIDASDFLAASEGHHTIGSVDWLVSVIETRLFRTTLNPLERRALGELLEQNGHILVDSLDEIADLIGEAEAERFLRSWLFGRAECATARTSYYESNLYGHSALAHFQVLFGQEPDNIQLREYIDCLCARLYSPSDAPVRAASVNSLREATPDLRELTHNPLLLTMCASLPDLGGVGESLDVSTVYHEFVRLSLDREVKSGRMTISTDLAIKALSEFAWARFRSSGGKAMGRGAIALAIRDVDEISNAERADVIATLESCPLLTLQKAPPSSLDDYDASFYHKSFEDYFVARRVEEWLCGRAGRGADFFECIDSPEVTFFVKEAIIRMSADAATMEQAASRLKNTLTQLLQSRKESSDERGARSKTFAAGQVAYYLSMIGDQSIRDWLYEIASTEQDFWIRRCACIGLAFGGAPDAVNLLIDRMREGIESGDFGLARQNIAVELGFYGDQRFDPLDPTADAGGANCTRLVGRSCVELRMNVEAANWRMILFNLLYLGQHRHASDESFKREMVGRSSGLLETLDQLAEDPSKRSFREIEDLRRLVMDLQVQS